MCKTEITGNGVEIKVDSVESMSEEQKSSRMMPEITITMQVTPSTAGLLEGYSKIPVREYYIAQLKRHHIWRARIVEDRFLGFTIYVPKTAMKRMKDFIYYSGIAGLDIQVKVMDNPLKLKKHTYLFEGE